MEFEFSEEQKMLQEMAADYFKRELPKTLVKDIMDGKLDLPQRMWDQMAAMGFMGLEIPKEYGGSSCSFLDTIVLLEEMGKACLPGAFFSTAILGASCILEAGSVAQKNKLLPPVAEGKLKLALAASDSSGSFEVKATRRGSSYVLTGVKPLVGDAGTADFIICLAKTGTRGYSLFLVPGMSQGLNLKSLPSMAWERQSEVVFENVTVPADNILGEAGLGWEHYQAVLQRAATAKCAEIVGGCGQVMQMTLQYANERHQFGHPIGSFQAIQHHCANMHLDLEASRYLTWHAAWRIAQHLPCAAEVAMAKAWVNEASYRITVLGHQVHGAIGYCWDHDMPLYYKQARMGWFSFGDTPHHEETVARALGL